MKKYLTMLLIGLMCCATLLDALAEAPAGQPENIEGQEVFAEPVQEQAVPMPGEAVDPEAEYLPQEVVAPADSVPEAPQQPEVPAEAVQNGAAEAAQNGAAEAVPNEAAEAAPNGAVDAGVYVFGETAVVESDTWQDVNLIRADGFSGPLALVNGQLTLVNVLINGAPARDADLSAYFSLGPTGRVAIRDGGALALDLSAFSFNKGSKQKLTLTENGVEVPRKRAKWSSSNKKVASVSKGAVKGKRAGSAVITAEYNGASVRCLVAVTDFKKVKSVKFNKSKLSLALFGSVQLAAAIRPADAYDRTLTWTSSAPEIVSVDQNGWIAGLAGGKATVTATASNGKRASCKVTVKEIKPKRVAFDQPRLALNIGEQYAVRAQFTPALVSNPVVSYSSDNPAVATVSADGVITAVGIGSAGIGMVCAANPTVTATCWVTVKDPDAQPATASRPFEITFMNVGRNDGILIRSGDEWAFIDSGGRGQGVKAVAYMQQRGVTALRYYIGTHAHKDHVGGAPVILAAIPTQEVIIPHSGVAKSIRKFAVTSKEKAAAKAASYRVVKFGETFDLGGAECLVLGPLEIIRASDSSTDENHNSLILRVTYGVNTFLLTGDGMKSEFLAAEAARPGCLQAQVFKNPHHNGRNEYAFLQCLPQIVVFSTNDANLPSAKYLATIQSVGSQVYVTSDNKNGHVTIISDGVNLSVITQ